MNEDWKSILTTIERSIYKKWKIILKIIT
jgi:hypothetical protein